MSYEVPHLPISPLSLFPCLSIFRLSLPLPPPPPMAASLRLVLALFCALALIASAAPSPIRRQIDLQRRADEPKNDPFYQPPEGFENEPLGAILRNRTVTAAFVGLVPDPVKSYQLLYRTEAINGTAIATATTIFEPVNAQKDKFVSFATAEDSSAQQCAPSYTYQIGSSQESVIVSVEFLVIQAYLAKGYIVASPDYEGPDSAFSPGRLEGRGVLDNMRAVGHFKDTLGLTTDTPAVVGVGYSGGAIATGWAASLQPTYAKDLNIKGWVQGGTPANLTGTTQKVDGTIFAGFLPAAVVGLSAPSAYGAQLNPIVDSIATEQGKEALAFAASHCAGSDLVSFAGQKIQSTMFQSLGDQLLYEPTIAKVLADCVMGVKQDETPTAPVFVYHAEQDEIIPYDNATTLVDSWCDKGASVKFTTFANGGHLTTEIVGLPDAMAFVESAFAGTTAPGCSKNTELSSVLDPVALGVELEPILTGLVNDLIKLGQMDENLKKDVSLFGMDL